MSLLSRRATCRLLSLRLLAVTWLIGFLFIVYLTALRPTQQPTTTTDYATHFCETCPQINKSQQEVVSRDGQYEQLQMPLLTDANSSTTVVEFPWLETKKLVSFCQSRGSSFYRSAGRLPTVSVIITFHSGETFYNVLHTLHSIFQRTPTDLLQQVLLVDDFSQKDEFGEPLEIYVKAVFGAKVQIIRNERNVGLIQSRLKGIRQSTGEVFVVMDSHSEVQPLWLEPIVYEISRNRRTLANSAIDWMSQKLGVWYYKYSGITWTVYFDWKLGFGWQTLPTELSRSRKLADPIETKVIIGGYAAMNREFFEEIGAFDEGMKLWGGENIDLALRTWLFGGRVVCVPCSRVAHLESPGSRDYRNNFTHLIEGNYKRIVEVWFDDYKKYFYALKPDALEVDAGDLTERFAVKKRASHDFDWFLTNVFPELGMFDRNSFAWGTVMNVGSKLCLDMNAQLTVYSCVKGSVTNQMFYWSDKFELRREMSVLISKPFQNSPLLFNEYIPFHSNDEASKWIHWKGGPIIDVSSWKCIEGGRISAAVQLTNCHYGSTQLWMFSSYSSEFDQLLVHGSQRYPKQADMLRQLMSQIGPEFIVTQPADTVNNRTRRSLSRKRLMTVQSLILGHN